VRDGLYPLQTLQRLLGSWWDFLVTDVTLGTAGNSERLAYLYDRRKVNFTGLAAELVLPPENNLQLARSPYVAGFRAGWAYLTLATVHIYYGTGVAVDPRRLEEITAFAKTLAKNTNKLSSSPQYAPGTPPVPDNLIMLGDFNIYNSKDATMQAITQAGFVVPEALQTIPGSNVDKNKHYDQIAYHQKLNRIKPTGLGWRVRFLRAGLSAGRRKPVRSGARAETWTQFQGLAHLPHERSLADVDRTGH
jgi:hypothetical protein